MSVKNENGKVAAGLLMAIFLWGANNAATKYLMKFWPPISVGAIRFGVAGLILLALLRFTKILGKMSTIDATTKKHLWFGCGLTLSAYIVCYTLGVYYTSASNVALYLGTAPVWALIWEERPQFTFRSLQSYGAASLALFGVLILFWPTLKSGGGRRVSGELFALGSSVLWTAYGRHCRALGKHFSSGEISAYTFWRASIWLLPAAVIELTMKTVVWRTDLVLLQLYCIVGSGVVAFILWNNGLKKWPTSKVYLFNNLIPLSTMVWASLTLGEPVSPTFWLAMLLIASGVILGQTNWQKVLGTRWIPE